MPFIIIRSYFQGAFIERELLKAQNAEANTSLGQGATPRSALTSSAFLAILTETGAQASVIQNICDCNLVYVMIVHYII